MQNKNEKITSFHLILFMLRLPEFPLKQGAQIKSSAFVFIFMRQLCY